MEESTAPASHHIIRTLPHLPAHSLHISLWTDLQNASFLRQQLLEGNRDFEYAFLDAEMMISETHLLAACFRALRDADAGRLKSQNVHSEIVFAMGMGNNIGESLRQFGIQTTTRSLVVVKVFPTPTPTPTNTNTSTSTSTPTTTSPTPAASDESSITAHLNSTISASPTPFTDSSLAQIRNLARLGKVYKIHDAGSGSASGSGGKGSGKGRKAKVKKDRSVDGTVGRAPEGQAGETTVDDVAASESTARAIDVEGGASIPKGQIDKVHGASNHETEKEGERQRHIARLERVAIAAIALRGAG